MKNTKLSCLKETALKAALVLITCSVFTFGSAQAQTDEETVAVLISIIGGAMSRVIHPDGVCLYHETEFRGQSRLCFTGSMPTLPASWNNQASSISVSSSYHATIHPDPNFGGAGVPLLANAPELASLDKLVSSIKITIKDEDGDGIIYSKDACPNTPAHESAFSDGCSLSQIDTDNDGVSDADDRCAHNVTGDDVGIFGCTLDQDSDGDGVSDRDDAYPFQNDTQCTP